MTNNRAKYILPHARRHLDSGIYPLSADLFLWLEPDQLPSWARIPNNIGFENYAEILGIGDEKVDKKAVSTASFSAFIFLGSTATTLFFGTFVAWVFNHNLPFLRQMRAIITMPLFAAPIALGWLGVVIFNEQSGPLKQCAGGARLGPCKLVYRAVCLPVLPSCSPMFGNGRPLSSLLCSQSMQAVPG